MPNLNVYAWTGRGTERYPGYLSVNKRQEHGLEFTVRTAGEGVVQTAVVVVPDEDIPELIRRLIDYERGRLA